MKKKLKISKASKKYDRLISKLCRSAYLLAPSEKKYLTLIKNGHILRPHYALGIYKAAILARKLGYEKISIIEFGCSGGNGLLDIEYHVSEITKLTGVEFMIYGFDTGIGLPETRDFRDVLYFYRPGQLKMDVEKLKLRITSSKISLGLVRDTVETFIEKNNPPPIGCIFNDLDFYSSTIDSFRIFDHDEKYFLPRVVMYFDDMHETSSYTGELGAIKSYNAVNELKKIDRIPQFAEELSLYWKKWIVLGMRFYYWHDFSHSKYSDFIGIDNNEMPLV